MSKNIKKRLSTTKEKLEKVCVVFAGRKTIDLTEYTEQLKYFLAIIEEYSKAKDKKKPPIDGNHYFSVNDFKMKD